MNRGVVEVRTMAGRDRVSHLLKQIDEAFSGVTLGDGVSLHETEVIDCYGTEEERLRARAGDEKDDWHKLVDDPELVNVCGIGGMCFYDAAGLRFHLPAYLSHVLANAEDEGDICQQVLFQLTRVGDERLSILNGDQRQCLLDVLVFLRDEYELRDAEVNRAIAWYQG